MVIKNPFNVNFGDCGGAIKMVICVMCLLFTGVISRIMCKKQNDDDLFWANDTNNHLYKPTATLKDYKEAIQILMVDYADVWEKTGTFKEVDKKLKKLGI